ncbi:peroxiredoxin family protein [Flexithrix dorotheae]|uniref:peroxiredoxin family protein n=1 Tax=Flexithrix dorotheae TaxID=70993 RepID=UPI000375BD84|nr:redoxin domain-containing protein [Flexithrix dorotheae]
METITFKNQKAIPFETQDYLGNAISLADYKGKKVLLTFFRYASCPFCNMRMQLLIRNAEKLKKSGVEILVLFASSAQQIKKYAGKQNPPFPIIPDAGRDIYKDYMIKSSTKGMLKTMGNMKMMMKMMGSGFFSFDSMPRESLLPADFLIDENQNIVESFFGTEFSEHIDIDSVWRWGKGEK